MAYNLSDPDFLSDPTPVIAEMRSKGPLVKVKMPLIGTLWCTTTDEAARLLLKTPDLFVRDGGAAGGKPLAERFWWMPPFMRPLLMNMLAVDGSDHTRLRHLVDTAFARTSIDEMRPRLVHIAKSLLDDLDPTQTVDLRRVYAQQLPLRAICELLGIPDADRAMITRWITPISGAVNGFTFIVALPGFWRLLRYFRSTFHEVRRTPRPGLISDLVAVENDGDRLSEDELLAMVITLFIAGHETTVHLITDGLRAVLEDTSLRQSIQSNPDKLPIMIEEFMRFFSPVMVSKPHYVARDTDFLGHSLKKDEMVMAGLIFANHDPARHDNPSALVPERRPNAHVGFGHGPHVCLGMQLARAEAQVAVQAFLQRFPAATTIGPADWSRRTGIRGQQTLRTALTSPLR